MAKLLGIPQPTIRSWQRRYGVPGATLEPGLHRYYSPADIEILRSMRDHIALGMSAAEAAGVVRRLTGRPAELAIALLDASQRLDAAAISVILMQAEAALGLAGCIDDVVMPAMRQIGEWWAAGRYTIPQEQMTTEAVRGWLDRRSTLAAKPSHPRPVLLACGPRDRHTIGAESLAMLLRVQGWQCRVMGAPISAVNLLVAVAASAPAAVVVVSHLAANRSSAVDALTEIDRAGVTVFYAGNAFASDARREDVPGTYLGASIGDACSLVCKILG